VSRGLFEKHKLIFLFNITLALLRAKTIGEDCGFCAEGMHFLLESSRKELAPSPLDWLSNMQWGAVELLSDKLDTFKPFADSIIETPQRFLEWFQKPNAEKEKLPMEWRSLDDAPFKKLLAIQCLRPDRLPAALVDFIRIVLPNGAAYSECDSDKNSYEVLEQIFADAGNTIPIYFILSPGVNVVADVDRLALKHRMTAGIDYHNISLGQGQDVFAQKALENGHKHGHWVILNNVHLMARWLIKVEKLLADYALKGSHKDFRVFLSSDPDTHIPVGILESCVKLTNDPPSGLKANLKQAFCAFSRNDYEEMDPRTKGIMFGLTHFHAIMLERRKFGPKGFNLIYPFSIGDLFNSASVLHNYMEHAPSKVPWDDLRYLFGEIMYGGHIINEFDRLLCATYLEHYMRDELLDEMELFPCLDDATSGLRAPATSKSYDTILEHIDTNLEGDSPLAYGLHMNAEVGFRTDQAELLFDTILRLSLQDLVSKQGPHSSQNRSEEVLKDILENYKDNRFDVPGLLASIDDMGPFENVFIQECERLNVLIDAMVSSLVELDLGFKGELTMSERMEELQLSLLKDAVPASWLRVAYPTMRPLKLWLADLAARYSQLLEWTNNPEVIPVVTWISGLFNPQSFLTAIMQCRAREKKSELDKMKIMTKMTKKMEAADFTEHSQGGAYICGLALEGARWDIGHSQVEPARPREMFSLMPVINCKAQSVVGRQDMRVFQCPVYMTQRRGPTYVFSAELRSKESKDKWVLAGVCLIMDII